MPGLPAPLIHLGGVLRPRLLRPDMLAASIAHIDFSGLKRAGFNAVVVDKDNCVTLPHADSVFPAYASAWNTLLSAFPGRVLVVSNSAGSAKDRGGIGAESLSMSLRAPVLAHARAKPACAKDILAFFQGTTRPHTLRTPVEARLAATRKQEDSAEEDMVRRWRKEVDGPLCGSLRTGKGRDVEKDMIKAQMRKEAPLAVPPSADAVVETRDAAAQPEKPHASERAFIPDAPLRILVIGDRKFTDTLQARELDTYLGASPFPSTLSIQTTNLPQPADVRILRRLENWLAGPDLAHGGSAGGVTWSQYSIPPPPPPPPPPTWLEQKKESARAAIARLNPVTALDDGGPPITRDPRSWRPRPVAAAVLSALGTAISATVRVARRGVAAGAKSAYAAVKVWGAQRVAAAKAERARRAQEKEQALVEKERDEAQAQAHASEAGKTLA